MTVLERNVDRLDELVDGRHPWSYRSRLHDLAGRVAGEVAVRESAERVELAINAFRLERTNKWTRVREWGAFALAAAAIAYGFAG